MRHCSSRRIHRITLPPRCLALKSPSLPASPTHKMRMLNVAQIRHHLPTLCGWFYLWIATGNLIGEILVRVTTINSYCHVSFGAFAAFQTNCIALNIAIGFPRFLITIFFLSLSLIKASIFEITARHVLNGFAYELCSLLILTIIVIPGFRYWYARSPCSALLITSIFALPIIYYGVRG